MFNGGGNSILFSPFGGLIDEVPPLIPFLCINLERLVVVRVYYGGLCDGLGSDSDRDRCVGNGGCH